MNLKTIGKLFGLGVALVLLALAVGNVGSEGQAEKIGPLVANKVKEGIISHLGVVTLPNQASQRTVEETTLMTVSASPSIPITLRVAWPVLRKLAKYVVVPVAIEVVRGLWPDKGSASFEIAVAETLVGVTEEGEIKPILAKSWEVSSDRVVWTFHLKEGIKFHDGETFNAKAVKANLDQILDPNCKVPARDLISPAKGPKVTRVDVIDDYTIRLITSEPFPRLLAALALTQLAIYSPKAIEDCKLKELSGTGPFKLVKVTAESPLTGFLAKNLDYWGEPPKLDEVVFSEVPDPRVGELMLKRGEVQVLAEIAPERVDELRGDPNIYVLSVPGTGTVYIGMNTRKEPFQDKRVRQAINYCVDKEEIVKYILYGFGHVSDAPIAPTIPGYTHIGEYPYDPAKGKMLLAEAGYPDGFETTLLVASYGVYPVVAEAVASYLAQCGIRVHVQVVDPAEFIQIVLYGEEYEMFLYSSTPLIRDAHDALFPVFHSHGSWNRTFYENPEVDRLLERAETELVDEERREIYRHAMGIIWDDAPWLFLYTPFIITGARNEVHGLKIYPEGIINISEAWIGD
jgi:ABC-type transport system substrate-binding protein